MDSTALRRLAGKMGLPLGTVERDQAITLALGVLAGQSFSRQMVFKGGTARGKAYFHDYRVSEDLDFTLSADVTEELLGSAKAFVRAGERAGVRFTGMKRDRTGRSGRRVLLRYEDLNGHANSIRVEMSLREKVLRTPELRRIHDPYGVLEDDLRIPTMVLPEILAEKVRALHMRAKARDLYDLWRLLGQGVQVEKDLVEAKFGWWKPGMRYDAVLLADRVRGLEPLWERDLGLLVANVPPFERVAADVRSSFFRPFGGKASTASPRGNIHGKVDRVVSGKNRMPPGFRAP